MNSQKLQLTSNRSPPQCSAKTTHTAPTKHELTLRNRLHRNRRGIALPAITPMRPIAERTLRRQATPAQRDRGLPRQVPLHPIYIHQGNRPLNTKRTIRTNRNLHRFRHLQNLIRHSVQHSLSTNQDEPSITNPHHPPAESIHRIRHLRDPILLQLPVQRRLPDPQQLRCHQLVPL